MVCDWSKFDLRSLLQYPTRTHKLQYEFKVYIRIILRDTKYQHISNNINTDSRQQYLPPSDTANNIKTAHGALRDVAYRLNYGVLYCQNTIRFQGARGKVISFRAIRKSTGFRAPIFMKLRPTQKQQHVQIPCTELRPNGTINVDSRCRTAYAALCNAWLSLGRFSESNQLFFWGGGESLVLNFIQIGRRT